jgi:hypothetical protein
VTSRVSHAGTLVELHAQTDHRTGGGRLEDHTVLLMWRRPGVHTCVGHTALTSLALTTRLLFLTWAFCLRCNPSLSRQFERAAQQATIVECLYSGPPHCAVSVHNNATANATKQLKVVT